MSRGWAEFGGYSHARPWRKRAPRGYKITYHYMLGYEPGRAYRSSAYCGVARSYEQKSTRDIQRVACVECLQRALDTTGVGKFSFEDKNVESLRVRLVELRLR